MKNKRIVIVLLLVCLLVSFSSSAFAFNVISSVYKLDGGIRNRYFWIDTNSVTGYWSTPCYNAINRWYNTETYFAFAQTYDRNASQLDFYTYNSADDNNGYTLHFTTTGMQAAPEIQSWKFCEIYLNQYNLQNTTTDFDSGVAAHEIGHVCGLDHNGASVYYLMYPYGSERLVTTPQADDINGVNFLYPDGY